MTGMARTVTSDWLFALTAPVRVITSPVHTFRAGIDRIQPVAAVFAVVVITTLCTMSANPVMKTMLQRTPQIGASADLVLP